MVPVLAQVFWNSTVAALIAADRAVVRDVREEEEGAGVGHRAAVGHVVQPAVGRRNRRAAQPVVGDGGQGLDEEHLDLAAGREGPADDGAAGHHHGRAGGVQGAAGYGIVRRAVVQGAVQEQHVRGRMPRSRRGWRQAPRYWSVVRKPPRYTVAPSAMVIEPELLQAL